MPSGRPRYPGLTPREQEVYDLLRDGLTNRQIADRLGISLDGAKYHVSQILMKLDVATREQAVAQPQERRVFGLAGVGALLRKLSIGSAMKAGAAAVAFVAVVVVALAVIGLLVTDRGSNDEQAVATPELPLTLGGEPSVFLALLEHVPATADSSFFYSDYAMAREILGVVPPSQDVGQGEMIAYWASLADAGMYQNPLSNDFTTRAGAVNSNLGLNIANLDASFHLGPNAGACGAPHVLRGRLDADRIEKALTQTSSFRDAVTQRAHNGVPYFTWHEGCTATDGLAGSGQVVLENDLAYWSNQSRTETEAMIDTTLGHQPSLAAAQEYQAIAQAFAELGVFTAYGEVHSDPLWFEPARELAEAEYGRNGPNVVAEQGYLRPYTGFALGAGYDDEGTYAVLIFLHLNEADATSNASILQDRIDSGTRYRGAPWSNVISRSAITVNGAVLQARLWAPDTRFLLDAYRDLDSLFVSRP